MQSLFMTHLHKTSQNTRSENSV